MFAAEGPCISELDVTEHICPVEIPQAAVYWALSLFLVLRADKFLCVVVIYSPLTEKQNTANNAYLRSLTTYLFLVLVRSQNS